MIKALLDTCIIEAAVTFLMILVRGISRKSRSGPENGGSGNFSGNNGRKLLCKNDLSLIYYNLLCNMLTNPLLNLGLYYAFYLGAGQEVRTILIIIGEAAVVASEYGLYRLMSQESRGWCFILSLVTNVTSYMIGRLLL